MNILFFTENQVHPNIGGIERVTFILARYFTQKGFNVYSSYIKPVKKENINTPFKNEILWDKSTTMMENIIKKNGVSIVICQRQLSLEKTIRKAIKASEKNCFLIDVLHCMPGYEITDKEYIETLYKNSRNISHIKQYIKLILYPIYKNYLKYLSQKNMQRAWDNCDSFVLLSDRLKNLFAQAYNISTTKKLTAINNPLTYNEFSSEKEILQKGKNILVVCRLEERSKRISIILKIWQKINELNYTDWKLIILGEGPDEQFYKKIANEYKLQNIYFEGRKEPLDYYKNASLLTITSANEGWGMTLTEAMQFGVVPIAMDSFPAIQDIIDNEINGIIVPNNDIDKYTQCLILLMNDINKRKEMALNAIEKSKSFSVATIGHKWIDLFNKLSSQKYNSHNE